MVKTPKTIEEAMPNDDDPSEHTDFKKKFDFSR